MGPAGARNKALACSTSPYVCVLDADDFFLPGRLSALLSACELEWDLLADDIVIVPHEFKQVKLSLGQNGIRPECKKIDLESFVRGDRPKKRGGRGLGFLKPIMRRAFLEECGLRYDENMRLGEDYALYVRALMSGARFYVAAACGYVATEQVRTLSSRHSSGDLDAFAAFDAKCLAKPRALTDEEVIAIREHYDWVVRRAQFSKALETKKDHGLFAALTYMLGHPQNVPHIAKEALRDKVKFALREYRSRNKQDETLPIRFMGIPGFNLKSPTLRWSQT
jgi:succinoglycan biosynthesis protein ExoU